MFDRSWAARGVAGLAWIAACALVVGCDGDDGPKVYKSSGVVTLDGEPLANVNVLFQSSGGKPAIATTDDEGKFQLGTFKPSDGALPGVHKVAVTENSDTPPPMPGTPEYAAAARKPPAFPRRYMAVDASGLEFEVTPEGPNEFAVELKSGR